MKAKFFFFIIAASVSPILLFSQNDKWFQKGISAKDPKEKIECFTKDIEVSGPSSAAYSNRGNAKSDMQDYPGAISDYSKAIELDQKNSTAYYNRGFAKFDLQDYKGAISDYSKTIELDPQNVTAYHNRGSAKSNLQDYQGCHFRLFKSHRT